MADTTSAPTRNGKAKTNETAKDSKAMQDLRARILQVETQSKNFVTLSAITAAARCRPAEVRSIK